MIIMPIMLCGEVTRSKYSRLQSTVRKGRAEHYSTFRDFVYCRKTGTPDISEDLLKTEIIVIKTTGNLISRSKRQNPAVLREYL